MALKKSEYARVNSFDLIGEGGWELLKDLVVENHPYLTLADLGATINLGIMGKLDKYKSQPLNVPRVYQWVEQRAPYSAGYWHTKYPELMAWATATRVAAAYVAELTKTTDANGVVIPVFSVAKTALRTLVGATYYPDLSTGATPATEASRLQQVVDRNHIETKLWHAFREQHPEFAAKHPNLF